MDRRSGRHGLIAKSFVPPRPLRELRELLRYRRKLVESQAAERNRLLKLLETANIKLASVANDVFGVSGRAMLRALIEGAASAKAMADLAKGQLRLWRDDFGNGGVAALEASIAPGPPPVEAREGVRISRCNCPRHCKKSFRWRRPRHTLKGRQTAREVDRIGLRLQLRKRQAEAGDIVLLYGDESEALTHPYLARAWAKADADLRFPAPGQAKKVAVLVVARSRHPPTHRPHEPKQAQH